MSAIPSRKAFLGIQRRKLSLPLEVRERYLKKVASELGRVWTHEDSGSILQGGADNGTMSRSVGLELHFLEKREQ